MQARLIENSLGGNEATLYTLEKIREFIDKFKINPVIRVLYRSILQNIDGRDYERIIQAIYDYSLEKVRYQKDIYGVETLQSPLRTLQLGFGDCDDFTILLGTLYEGAGLKTRIVLVTNRPNKIYSHVFIQVFNGREWITADPVENYLGTGYLNDITKAYIEGEGERMQLLMLEGLGQRQKTLDYIPLNKPKKKVWKQRQQNLNGFLPVLMGLNQKELDYVPLNGLFSSIKKTVSSVVAPVVNTVSQVAQTVAQPLASVANTALNTVVNTVTKPLTTAIDAVTGVDLQKYIDYGLKNGLDINKIVSTFTSNPLELAKMIPGVSTVVSGVDLIKDIASGKNLIDSVINNAKGALPPYVTTAISIVQDPKLLTDPKNLLNMAVNQVLPPELRALSSTAVQLVSNPKALLDPEFLFSQAKEIAGQKLADILPPDIKKTIEEFQEIAKTSQTLAEKMLLSQLPEIQEKLQDIIVQKNIDVIAQEQTKQATTFFHLTIKFENPIKIETFKPVLPDQVIAIPQDLITQSAGVGLAEYLNRVDGNLKKL